MACGEEQCRILNMPPRHNGRERYAVDRPPAAVRWSEDPSESGLSRAGAWQLADRQPEDLLVKMAAKPQANEL